jgi:hypothetical protein
MNGLKMFSVLYCNVIKWGKLNCTRGSQQLFSTREQDGVGIELLIHVSFL